MKVVNFNNDILSKSKQDKKQNLQNKANTMKDPVNFKGSAANNSLSAMGKAQVNMNKSIAFKGRPPVAILANVRERVRPERLRNFKEEFERKIVQYYPSETHFDNEVMDFMLERDKSLNVDNANKIYNLAYRKSSMGEAKFDNHVLPTDDHILQYGKNHSIHGSELARLKKDFNKGTLRSTAAGVAGFGAMALATGGVGLLVGGAAYLAGLGGSIINGQDYADRANAYMNNIVAPEMKAKCLVYKLKEMIRRSKVTASDVVKVVRHCR